MTSQNLGSVPVNVYQFDIGKPRSDYDKIKKGKLTIYPISGNASI